MNSTQGKMRTNGVFLRSFDSKRYQELQLQKQQILQRQKELLRIKDKQGVNKTKREAEYSSLNDGQDANGNIETEEIGNGSVMHNTLEMSKMKKRAGNVFTVQASVHAVRSPTEIVEAKVTQSNELEPTTGSEKKTNEVPKCPDTVTEETVNDKVKADKKQYLKEYAIIAEQNKHALQRETQLVEQEADIESQYSKIVAIDSESCKSLSDTDINDISNPCKLKQFKKEKKKDYAIVDLDKTLVVVQNMIKEGKENGVTKTESMRDTEVENIGSSTDTLKGDSGDHVVPLTNDLTQIYVNRKQHAGRMSRSAGYSGDIDTSTSSLETDIDSAIDKFLAKEVYSKEQQDRLVITEEQISRLHNVGSSSSG